MQKKNKESREMERLTYKSGPSPATLLFNLQIPVRLRFEIALVKVVDTNITIFSP